MIVRFRTRRVKARRLAAESGVVVRRVLLLAVAVLALTAAPASARVGSCLGGGPGHGCHVWTGKVTKFTDGDTFDVDIDGDGTHHAFTVRFASVQAMEMHIWQHPSNPRHECYAAEASARVRTLVRASHHRVRLTAQDPRDRADVRLRRAIAVHVGGRWRDLGEMLTEEGHTLWMDGIVETRLNRPYALAEQRARLRGRNMWDPTHCGVGPAQDVPLKVWANWDPDGSDVQHLDEEWTKIRNDSPTQSISLARWWLRDSLLRRYTFPAGTTLAPGQTITVYTGPGPNSPLVRHWGLHQTIFENPGDSRHLGDGAYVFDPQGDLRSAFVYPCLIACGDPLQGAVAIDAHPRGMEYVDLRNVSGAPVDLYGYRLYKRGFTYAFGQDSVLRPGESLRVYVGGSPGSDSPLVRHWGLRNLLLRDDGDHLEVSTFDGIRLACAAWGDDRC